MIDYKENIRRHYDSSLLNSFLQGTNDALNKALDTKKSYAANWEKIVSFYKKRGYARDTSNSSHLQTNTLIIGFNEMNEGIILNISYLPFYIGIYFHHKTIDSMVPVIDSAGKYNYQLSFFPYSLKQETRANELLALVNYYFSDFEVFNNIFASEKINNVVIDQQIKEESTLFHVLFEDNMYTVF